MRDPKRIKVLLEALESTWNEYPDFRLGQLMVNINSNSKMDTFFVEDDEMLKRIKDFNK